MFAPAAAPGGASAPASVSPAAATADAPAAASSCDHGRTWEFHAKLRSAVAQGAVSESLGTEIRQRFAAPFDLSGATATASPEAAAAQAGTAQWLSLATQQTLASETRQKDLDARHVVVATELLNLLLLCDSGYYNSELDTPGAATDEVGCGGVKGLHAAVAGIARSASSNVVQYLRKELTSGSFGAESLGTLVHRHAVPLGDDRAARSSSHGVGDGVSATQLEQENRMWQLHRIGNNPVLLAAQCLYLLTRHFQLPASSAREVLELVELLLLQLPHEAAVPQTAAQATSRGRALRALCHSPRTAATCAVVWLVVFAAVNVAAVWKKLRNADGVLAHNALLHSDVATVFADTTQRVRHRIEPAAPGPRRGTGIDPYAFLDTTAPACRDSDATGLDARRATSSAGLTHGARRPWVVAVWGFVSVLCLAEGCLRRAKDEEAGYERALEALLGDRGTASRATSPWRGKAAQRMVQLAPLNEALRMPSEYVYIAPYEMLSYVFDHLVPVLRRLAELELGSYRRYVDQPRLPEPQPSAAAWHACGGDATGGGGLLRGIGQDTVVARRTWQKETFSTEMAALLAPLATCLEELPSEVLDPDLDSDCAATFFIFRNCARHLVHVFAMQQRDSEGRSQWLDFTLKTVTQFLNVLTMIGRHPQYLSRLVAMLSGTQAACPELQWSSLLAQALECAGLTSSTGSTTLDQSAVLQPSVEGQSSEMEQSTPAYSRRRRQEYVEGCFMLLRQLVTSHALRGIVHDYLDLDTALAFLTAPRQSQPTLGSTLSLIAALVTSAEDAARVWGFLHARKLLLLRPAAGMSTSTVLEDGVGATTRHETTTSLLGHARYESTQGRYPITRGLLHLLLALCRYDVCRDGAAVLASDAAVVDFVAQEVLRGVSRRVFVEERERWTVLALAAAALRQALLVRFATGPDDALVFASIPLSVVMATNKAPNDVLGELLQCLERASTAPYDLGPVERAALRQGLGLLHTALVTLARQKLELFAFSARTVQSESLALHLLLLCGVGQDDDLLARALELLLLLPTATVTQAARQLHAAPSRLAGVIARLASVLRPGCVPGSLTRASPELALLETPREGAVPAALLLELLARHAVIAAPSLTLLLCGFYDAVRTPRPPSTEAEQCGSALFAAVLDGVTSPELDRTAPELAVQYVQLLYLLRANPLCGTSVVRPCMERGTQHVLLQLQQLSPLQSPRHPNPLRLRRYAYVLRLLALETLYVARHQPSQLSPNYRGIPDVTVEVLLSLLQPGRASGVDVASTTTPAPLLPRDAAADVAEWLTEALADVPAFPAYELPFSDAAAYTTVTAEGVVQLEMARVLAALQRGRAERQQPPYSLDELRARLQPYVAANACLMHYAAVTHFVEAWCQLVELACSVVRQVPQDRLRTLVHRLLAGIAMTRGMTAAAQESLVRRLCTTLATVVAHLVCPDGVDAVRASVPRAPHRRPRHEPETTGPNQSLLRPLLTTTVQWGAALPAIRADLYDSLLCLTTMAGVVVEDVMLYRSQERLLRMLVQDVCGATATVGWASASALLVRLLTASPALADALCQLDSDTPPHSAAVRAGVALLTTTSRIMTAFVVAAGPADPGAVLGGIENCFDYLCAIATCRAAGDAFATTLLPTCLALDVWAQSTPVLLALCDRGTASATSSQTVWYGFLYGVLRWVGVVLGRHPTRVRTVVHDFVLHHRPLLETAMRTPITTTGVGRVQAVFASLLRALASTSHAVTYRRVVREMGVLELLLARCVVPERAVESGTASLLAATVRDLAHLLLRVEYAVRREVANNDDDRTCAPRPDLTAWVEGVVRATDAITSRVAHLRRPALASPADEVVVCYADYLLALQALVCLLHHYVLPRATEDNDEAEPQSSLPLPAIAEVLLRVQQTMSDAALAVDADTVPLAHGPAYLTRSATVATAMQKDLNNPMRGPARPDTTAPDSSAPVTPLTLPEDSTRLMGTKTARHERASAHRVTDPQLVPPPPAPHVVDGATGQDCGTIGDLLATSETDTQGVTGPDIDSVGVEDATDLVRSAHARLPHLVRQVRIAVANALSATKAALSSANES